MSGFRLVDLPNYVYTNGEGACPACYKPVTRAKKDGHCDECLHDRDLFPVNFKRKPKKKEEDEDEFDPWEFDY
jgi:hypothetical protein